MEHKHFLDSTGMVHGLLLNGSQDHLIKNDWTPIQDHEVQTHADNWAQSQFEELDWYRKRIYNYPEVGEFIDAYIKGDTQAMEEYKQKCFAVKAKYPKPPGF